MAHSLHDLQAFPRPELPSVHQSQGRGEGDIGRIQLEQSICLGPKNNAKSVDVPIRKLKSSLRLSNTS